MKTENVFLSATKAKLRFNARNGGLTTEDLWDLSLADLDNLGRNIRKSLNELGDESLLEDPDVKVSKFQREGRLKFDVVKEVIDFKQAENRARRERAKKAGEIQFLESLLEKKRLDQMEEMDLSEIEARLAAAKGEPVPQPETAGASS